MGRPTLTLAEALRTDRLDDFVTQVEESGLEPIDEADFDRALGKLVKPRRSEDRTSRSASRGGSSGK
jgi:hypothetical protein